MNNPSPLVPQGSFLEQKNKSRARVRFAVFFVLSVHVVGLMALLMQGCRKDEQVATTEPAPDTNSSLTMPSFDDTNSGLAGSTSAPVVTSNVAPPMMENPALPAAPAAQEYTIVRGDTLSGIAKKFPGVTWKQIQDANPGINPSRLQPGKKLVIPAATATPAANSAATAPATAEAAAAGEQTYSVKSGDNLTKIATQFGTSVRALRSLNNLTTDRIQVGQKLKIPAKAAAPAPVTTTPAVPGVTNP